MHDPDFVTISRSDYEWLTACYWSPLTGMGDLAEALVAEWGHDPAAHPELVDEMALELSGAIVDTAADLMRDRGLPDLRVEPRPTASA